MRFQMRPAIPGRLPNRIRAAQAGAGTALRRGLSQLGELGEAVARSVAPIGPSGNYYLGIGHQVHNTTVVIGSSAPHAHLVEHGRSPGKMPPPARIQALMGLGPHEAFLVARAIGEQGTDGFDVFGQVRDRLAGDARRIGAEIASEIGGLRS